MTTLRRTLRTKFEEVLKEKTFGGIDMSLKDSDSVWGSEKIKELSEFLADAAIDAIREEKMSPQKELSPEKIQDIIQSANKTVDGILANSIPPEGYFKGRELLADNHLHYADWYHKVTNQVMTKRSQKSWWKAFKEWQSEGLAIEHLQTAYDVEIAWRKFITDPNQLTAKAVAIKAAGTKKVDTQPVELDDNDIPMSY